MNPLLKRLATLRFKVRLLDGWQGLCAVFALVLGVGVTVGVLDFWLHLPSLARALALIGLLVGGCAVVYRFLLRPFANPCDDLTLALRIEEHYPELNDALATTVQFLKQPREEQDRVGGSVAMRERTVGETLARIQICDFGRILDRRAGVLYGSAAFIVLLIGGLVIGAHPQYAGIAALRLLEPFGHHTWTRIAVTRVAPGARADQASDVPPLEPYQKDRIAINRPYFIRVQLDGQIPQQAKVEIVGQQIRSDKVVPLQVNPKDKTATFVTSIDMTQQHQKFKYRILANDGTFPPRANSFHEVEVLPPPKLVAGSPHVTIYPPRYADLGDAIAQPPGSGHLDVFAGTNVDFRATADRPLEEASIEYRPESEHLKPAAIVAFFGETHPLQAVGQLASSQALWGRYPAKFEPADPDPAKKEEPNTRFHVRFMPWVSGDYVLLMRDADRLERQEIYNLRVKRDPLPDVKLIRPERSVTARPDGVVPFKFRVSDDIFAVRSVYVEYQRKQADGIPIGPRERIVLYASESQGAMIPFWLGQLGLRPRTQLDRLRRKQLEFEATWQLKNRFKEGEIILVEVCADDFCDIYGKRDPGRSHAIELRIVGPEQIVRNVGQQLNEIRKKVEQVEQMQKKALDAVKEIKKLDKLDQKAMDKLIEAEQQQKDVQSQIGKTAEQGLRKDLGDLLKLLKDNKLDKTPVAQQAGKIEGALDQIGQNELPQIEPRLAEARNDLTHDPKKSKKSEKNLGETAELQKKVLDGLAELNKDLAPFAKMQDLRDNLRDLTQKQQDLVRDIEQMKDTKNDNIRDNPELKKTIEKQFADDLKRKGQEQQDIAQQMQKLIEQLKAAQKEREREGNKEDAKKLQEAIDKAEPKEPKEAPKPKQAQNTDPITKQMNDVARDLKDKKDAPQQTLDKANDILKNLDQMMGALEGRNQDTTRQEMKELQQQQQKMDQLAKKMQQLQNETKKAQQIENPEERLKKEEELAKKHAQLQEEIEKQARELARLQEKRAAAALNDAAKDLAGAQKKLGQGEDPQQEQKDARDKINQARNEIADSQEELAREMLIKIADQLKGLKERQDAVLERSETFQTKLLKRKTWTDAFLDTIEGNIDTQKGIAEESVPLKEKIKGAKVFADILERAKESMDKAAEAMKNRMDEGKDLRKPDPTEKLSDDEVKNELQAHETTVRHQKQAARRLDNLLDALKEELERLQKPRVAKKENPDQQPEKKDQPRPRNADGIPSIAELKLLKGEQEDLLERTSKFAERNPNLKDLTDAQRTELAELHREQERLQELFQQVSAPPQKEGGLP